MQDEDSGPIYLDYHAHAPIDPRVVSKLIAAFGDLDANPHSSHTHGSRAHDALETARGTVALLLDGRPKEIIFTSGATEANNLALSGLAGHLRSSGRTHLIVSSIEHPSILRPAEMLASQGFDVDVVPVGRDGLLDISRLSALMGERTGLVSVAAANHEIGTIQPIDEISRIVRANGSYYHSDLAQAAGKMAFKPGLFDLASLTAHKLCGPIGVGALFVGRRLRSKLAANLIGGGQEGGLRSGTVSAPLCVAFAEACAIAASEMALESRRVRELRDFLLASLLAIPGAASNGASEPRLPGNINVRFADVDGEALAMRLQSAVSVSTGSACSAKTLEPSPVLMAIGLSRDDAESSIRIGLGRFTTRQHVEEAAREIASGVAALRSTRNRSGAWRP